MALNKYKDAHAKVNPPSFSALGIDNARYVDELLVQLIPSNMDDLMPKGWLHACVKIMGATIVMSYNFWRQTFKSQDPLVKRLEDVAKKVGVGAHVLPQWSTNIETHFYKQNKEQGEITSENDIIPALNGFANSIHLLKQQVGDLSKELHQLNFNLKVEKLINIKLREDLEQLSDDHQKAGTNKSNKKPATKKILTKEDTEKKDKP